MTVGPCEWGQDGLTSGMLCPHERCVEVVLLFLTLCEAHFLKAQALIISKKIPKIKPAKEGFPGPGEQN